LVFEAWYVNLDPSNQEYIRLSLIEQHLDAISYKYSSDTFSFMTIAKGQGGTPKVRETVSKLRSER
jgi:hypothetical protein